MTERQKELLGLIIREHIKSARPVGSAALVDAARLDLSSATLRNEMAVLEEEGYICQPHSSAGRVPTQKGYHYFVDHFMRKTDLAATDTQPLRDILRAQLDTDAILRACAKELVAQSNETVIVAFDKNTVFYTGISNLFSKPEFAQPGVVTDISRVIDDLDERVSRIFDQVQRVEILIADQNPFWRDCAAVVGKYRMRDEREGLFFILGPMRMDYERNLALVEYVRGELENV